MQQVLLILRTFLKLIFKIKHNNSKQLLKAFKIEYQYDYMKINPYIFFSKITTLTITPKYILTNVSISSIRFVRSIHENQISLHNLKTIILLLEKFVKQ